MLTISGEFCRLVELTRGPAGLAWLDRVPAIITACAEGWGLAVEPPFPDLSYNYVAPVTRSDGTTAVLKVCFPEPELHTEIAALRHFDGSGAVRLLAADPARGAILLERVLPGESLADLADDVAMSAAASVLRRLQRPAPADVSRFPTITDWFRAFDRLRERHDGGSGPIPAHLLDAAERLVVELLASTETEMLLHGDLHHGNVLSAAREPWLAIDPKGIVGDPTFDTSALFYNPPHFYETDPNPGCTLARRIDQLAEELAFDRERVRGWGIAKAVLSAVWFEEERGAPWEPALGCAQLMLDRAP